MVFLWTRQTSKADDSTMEATAFVSEGSSLPRQVIYELEDWGSRRQ